VKEVTELLPFLSRFRAAGDEENPSLVVIDAEGLLATSVLVEKSSAAPPLSDGVGGGFVKRASRSSSLRSNSVLLGRRGGADMTFSRSSLYRNTSRDCSQSTLARLLYSSMSTTQLEERDLNSDEANYTTDRWTSAVEMTAMRKLFCCVCETVLVVELWTEMDGVVVRATAKEVQACNFCRF
jgi:hypothetical protein